MNTYVHLGLQLNGRRAFRNRISDYKFEKKTVSSRLDDVQQPLHGRRRNKTTGRQRRAEEGYLKMYQPWIWCGLLKLERLWIWDSLLDMVKVVFVTVLDRRLDTPPSPCSTDNAWAGPLLATMLETMSGPGKIRKQTRKMWNMERKISAGKKI
jgi:hypothetical protein